MNRQDSNIKISVIIPIYNAEKWLEQCLNSVLEQTLKEIEVLCVDDGSTDGSLNKLRDYEAKSEKIKVYSIQNSGAAKARNYALERATGQFVTFLDADDYYPNNTALEAMYKGATDNGALVCAGLRQWDYDGMLKPQPLHRNVIEKHPQGAMVKFSDFQHDYHYHSYIYSLDLIKNNQIEFPDYVRYEDPVFFVKVMVKAKKFFVIPSEVYVYRKKGEACRLGLKATLDTIHGITENLKISSEEKLAKLHFTCVQRLNKEYCEDILRNLDSEYKSEIVCALEHANAAQDYGLIHAVSNDYPDGTMLYPLQRIRQNNTELKRKNIVQRGIACIRENGVRYTLKRIKEKIGRNKI